MQKSINYTENPNFKPYKIGEILEFFSRKCELEDNRDYQLVTVKRRNEGIVERGIFKGEEIKTPSQFYLKSGDFLISKRQIVHGACEIVPEVLDGAIVSNEYTVARGKSNIISTEYFNILSKTSKMKNHYFLSSYGVDIEKMVFNVELWKKGIVYIPSLEEQRKIVKIYYTLDKKIQLQQQKHDLLQEQKKGYMEKIFKQEIRFKDEDGKNYPNWSNKKIKDMGKVYTGNTPSKNIESYWNKKEYIWVTPSDITQKKEISSSYFKLSREGFEKARKLPKNSLLITCIASIGKNAILKVEGACNQQINAIVPYVDFDIDFLYYLIENFQKKLMSIAGKTATSIINKNSFENVEYLVPGFKEQKEIAIFLSGLDKKIENEYIKLEYLKKQKKGFMQQMFI